MKTTKTATSTTKKVAPPPPKPAPKPVTAAPKKPPTNEAAKKMISAKAAAAVEPPKDRDTSHLSPAFATKLAAVLAQLAKENIPFKFDEGFRTVDRQQWLYGSGRPNAKPYGRSGPIVTYKDGVKELSNHQGNGKPGSGNAADCYPMANGSIIWPPPPITDKRWKRYADLAKEQGLDAGYYWKSFKDIAHIELK